MAVFKDTNGVGLAKNPDSFYTVFQVAVLCVLSREKAPDFLDRGL